MSRLRRVLGLLALGTTVAVAAGTTRQGTPRAPSEPSDEVLVERACSPCHVVPAPDVLPRGNWRTVAYEMAGMIMGNVGAPPGTPPLSLDFDVERIVRYYEERAPQALPSPEPWPPPGSDPSRFARHALRPKGAGAEGIPLVANVRFFDLDGSGELQVVAVDMSAGLVLAGDPRRPEAGLSVIGRVPNPCHTETVDLDKDGRLDLVVANLGDVPPEDHEKGSVVWMKRLPDGTYRNFTLATGLPRVTDVEPADVDGDGDLDLVVAAFGWRTVGGILLLENRTTDWSHPTFVRRPIDPRPGTIHVQVTDIDGDGRLDFVALLAQHYESVEAFLGNGKGDFRPQVLWKAPHPAWGSSGLTLVDFDGDRDLDVLVTNGDMLDDFLMKPYHGIRWLENKGGLRFEEHPLANLPGVHRALTADLDGDGDLDVVACAYVDFRPPGARVAQPMPDQASLVWLEQTSPGQFKRHTLETGAYHVTMDVGDYDRDGDVDVVVGHFRTPGSAWVDVWENLRVKR
jgi:FG-GAP-like repeat